MCQALLYSIKEEKQIMELAFWFEGEDIISRTLKMKQCNRSLVPGEGVVQLVKKFCVAWES